jgi:hypothetical protein
MSKVLLAEDSVRQVTTPELIPGVLQVMFPLVTLRAVPEPVPLTCRGVLALVPPSM